MEYKNAVLHESCWAIDTNPSHLPTLLHSISDHKFSAHWPSSSSYIYFKHFLPTQTSIIALLTQYMNRSPHQAGSSLQQGEYTHYNTASNHCPTPTANANHHVNFSNDMIGTPQGSGGLQDSFDQHYGSANGSNQYHAPRHALGAERNDLHNRQASEAAPPFATPDDHALLRGMRTYAGQSSPGSQNRGLARKGPSFFHSAQSPYMNANSALASASPAQPSSRVPVQHFAPSDEPIMERHTKYEPYSHLFNTAEQARDHRRRGTMFGRVPYLEMDGTIADVERDRARNVMRIYNAMTRGESAKDNRGSIAMKRWVLDAHYPPDLVEAYAHKMFDCLLQQAKEGFRGWQHNDYVADERKGDDVDKEVDCAGRLDNIIIALEQEKTICEDVMNSACQIRMFVNAPRAYANRKHQNRVGNSKRGRTKDTPDPNPRSAKAQRTCGRRTRARSSAATEISSSRDTTPHYQQALQRPQSGMPYYTSPAPHQFSLSPVVSHYPPARSTPLHRPTLSAPRSSFAQQSIPAISMPTSSPQTNHAPQAQMQRVATEPPHPGSPFMSPPTVSHGSFSTPGTPDEIKPLEPILWNPEVFTSSAFAETRDEPAVDPHLAEWDFPSLIPCEGEASGNVFSHEHGGFVNMAEIERSSPEGAAEVSNQNLFEQYWQNVSSVQAMPSTEGHPKS